MVSWTEHEGVCRATPPHRCGCTPTSTCFPAIPEVRSSTAETRVVLPEPGQPRRRPVQLSRAALLVVALTERPDLLMAATEDRPAPAAACGGHARVGGIPADPAALWCGSGAVRRRTCGHRAQYGAGTARRGRWSTAPRTGSPSARCRSVRASVDVGRRSFGADLPGDTSHTRIRRVSCFQHRCGLSSLSSGNRSVCACADTRTTTILLVDDGSPHAGESRRSPLQWQWWAPAHPADQLNATNPRRIDQRGKERKSVTDTDLITAGGSSDDVELPNPVNSDIQLPRKRSRQSRPAAEPHDGRRRLR